MIIKWITYRDVQIEIIAALHTAIIFPPGARTKIIETPDLSGATIAERIGNKGWGRPQENRNLPRGVNQPD